MITPPSSRAAEAPAPSPRRIWAVPTVVQLPKLTDLTLASPIGGGGGIGGSTVFGILLAVGLLFGIGACGDDSLARPSAPTGGSAISELVTCRAQVATGTVTCGGPVRSSGTATFGSQGVNVGLRSSNTSYNGTTGIFSADVSVQNLTGGPIGTTDGTTKGSGVKVFFVSGPTPDIGFAAVANPTGFATFTASSQPYFLYDTLLGPQAVSQTQTWQFALGGGATSFTFAVLVSADVPVVGGLLHWSTVPQFSSVPLRGISGWSTGFAVFGDNAEVFTYSGGVWSSNHDPANPPTFSGVGGGGFAAGPNDLIRLGGDFTIHAWDGISWRSIESESGGPGSTGLVFAVGSSPATGDYALGFSLWSHLANSWTTDTVPSSLSSLTASTVVGGDLLATGFGGSLWYRHQHDWIRVDTVAVGMLGSPFLILAPDTGHVWLFANETDGRAAEYWNGASWSVPALPGTYLAGYTPADGYAVDSDNVYLAVNNGAGNGALWHWDGSTWSTLHSASDHGYSDVWVAANGNVYVTELDGSVELDSAGTWSYALAPAPLGQSSTAWVVSSSDEWVGTDGGQLFHFDGARWSKVRDYGGGFYGSVWAGGSDVWAVTNNVADIEHFDGSSWGSASLGGMSPIAVGGSSPSDVWVVGSHSAIAHYNGSSWTTSVSADSLSSNDLAAVWATSGAAAAVGASGTIVMWNGSSWSKPSSPTGQQLNAVSGTSSTDIWAVGNAGVIVHWNGVAWGTVSSGTGNALTGVWARSPGEVYAVGQGGTVLRYDGASWQPVSILGIPGQNYTGIAGAASGVALITGPTMVRGTR